MEKGVKKMFSGLWKSILANKLIAGVIAVVIVAGGTGAVIVANQSDDKTTVKETPKTEQVEKETPKEEIPAPTPETTPAPTPVPNMPADVVGFITKVDSKTVVVGDITFAITPVTVLKDDKGVVIDTTILEVGQKATAMFASQLREGTPAGADLNTLTIMTDRSSDIEGMAVALAVETNEADGATILVKEVTYDSKKAVYTVKLQLIKGSKTEDRVVSVPRSQLAIEE